MTGAVGHHHVTRVTRMSSSRVAHVITVSLLPPPRDRPINRPTDCVAPRRAAPRRAASERARRTSVPERRRTWRCQVGWVERSGLKVKSGDFGGGGGGQHQKAPKFCCIP